MTTKRTEGRGFTKLGPVTSLKKPVNQEAISVLEDVLSSVRDGEIISVCVSYVQSDGSIAGDWSAGDDLVKQWAAAQHVERSFYNQNIDCIEE